MSMKYSIELLNASLLNNLGALKKISYWLRVMNRPNGWHYDLDKVWIINELEKKGLHKGSTLLDAGSGQSEMPYLLASMGYNIVSLDFSERVVPERSKGIFQVEGDGMASIEYEHPYMGIINYGNNPLIARINLSNAFKIPSILITSVMSKLVHLWERYIKKHDAYGFIKLLRASFHDIPIQSQSIDAIFSISAIEHAEINHFDKNIKEFERIVKPGGIILITTSANNLEDSTYDDETSGMCFSQNDLNKHFPNATIEFNYEADERSILDSKLFTSRIDSYYWRNKKSFFYNKNFSKLPYMPVGIKIIK